MNVDYRIETCVMCGAIVLVHPSLKGGEHLCTDCAEARWALTEAGKREVAR
jgi:hypothetical protein